MSEQLRMTASEYRKIVSRSSGRLSHVVNSDNPTEEDEQRRVARRLDELDLDWFHVPNGGSRCKAEGGKLKAQGVKRGANSSLEIYP